MTRDAAAVTPWRDLDAATREREYSPSSCIGGNYQPFIQAYIERSRDARSRTPGRLDLAYGPGPSQRLDLFVPAPRPGGAALAPVLVFIHGGYWQELSKSESAFAAGQCAAQGIALAALDYTLAPRASVAEMVVECRAAVAWLEDHALMLGLDAGRIVVAGSSAGAHLAAMTALAGLSGVSGVGGLGGVGGVGGTSGANVAPAALAPRIRGVVLVSGIYELEPLVGTSINAALRMTPESARELSPALRDLRGFPQTVMCWGEVETREFKRQSRDFAALLERACTPCEAFEVPQRNHFDVILDLADPGTALGRALMNLIRSL